MTNSSHKVLIHNKLPVYCKNNSTRKDIKASSKNNLTKYIIPYQEHHQDSSNRRSSSPGLHLNS